MPVRNFRHPFANHSIFARHFTPPGPSTTPRRPRRRVAKVSEKMAFKIITPVRRIACLFPEPDPKEDPEEFHKGPREDPLGEGGGRSRMRGEGRRRTWSAPNVEYSAQLPCLCATFDPVKKVSENANPGLRKLRK